MDFTVISIAGNCTLMTVESKMGKYSPFNRTEASALAPVTREHPSMSPSLQKKKRGNVLFTLYPVLMKLVHISHFFVLF